MEVWTGEEGRDGAFDDGVAIYVKESRDIPGENSGAEKSEQRTSVEVGSVIVKGEALEFGAGVQDFEGRGGIDLEEAVPESVQEGVFDAVADEPKGDRGFPLNRGAAEE
jgi:hypothetical protein